MDSVSFPYWDIALSGSALEDSAKEAYRITLRWYLAYCRDHHCGVDFNSARAFVEESRQTHQNVPAWAVELWKSALNWFFRNAKHFTEEETEAHVEILSDHEVKTMRLKPGEPEWRLKMLTVIRRRHMSYRTETTYIGWVLRFAKFVGRDDR